MKDEISQVTPPNDDWICIRDRPPTEADADFYGCILVCHIWQGVMLIGWHRIHENRFYSHWMSPPGPPPNHKKLRETWEQENQRK